MQDGEGLTGALLHYAFLFWMLVSTSFVFFTLLKRKKLHMDEEAKYHLFKEGE